MAYKHKHQWTVTRVAIVEGHAALEERCSCQALRVSFPGRARRAVRATDDSLHRIKEIDPDWPLRDVYRTALRAATAERGTFEQLWARLTPVVVPAYMLVHRTPADGSRSADCDIEGF